MEKFHSSKFHVSSNENGCLGGGGVAPKWLTGGEQPLGLDDFVPSPTSYIVSPETQTF
jgi:hypothetical protein